MFVVRDWTRNPSYTMVSNDVKDVRDIVIGITGDETIGDHVLLHLGHTMLDLHPHQSLLAETHPAHV